MSDLAIRVDGIGKEYRIGHARRKHRTLRDALMEATVAPFRRAGRLLRAAEDVPRLEEETIWALRDVSFEVQRGEVVGIIGRNGGGQEHAAEDPVADHRADRRAPPRSTAASSSLLEVGTGFHPELTGRENIFLNGAILGHEPGRDRPQVRRDRGLRRGREVHRHAGEALFERHVSSGWRSPSRRTWSPRS